MSLSDSCNSLYNLLSATIFNIHPSIHSHLSIVAKPLEFCKNTIIYQIMTILSSPFKYPTLCFCFTYGCICQNFRTMFARLSSGTQDPWLRPRLFSTVFYRNQQKLKRLTREEGCWFQQTVQTPLKVSAFPRHWSRRGGRRDSVLTAVPIAVRATQSRDGLSLDLWDSNSLSDPLLLPTLHPSVP